MRLFRTNKRTKRRCEITTVSMGPWCQEIKAKVGVRLWLGCDLHKGSDTVEGHARTHARKHTHTHTHTHTEDLSVGDAKVSEWTMCCGTPTKGTHRSSAKVHTKTEDFILHCAVGFEPLLWRRHDSAVRRRCAHLVRVFGLIAVSALIPHCETLLSLQRNNSSTTVIFLNKFNAQVIA